MKNISLGYACINETLHELGYSTNNGMIRKTFLDKGLSYVSQLTIKNLNSLSKVVDWNYQNNINFYRISSSVFPWMSEYEIKNLPDFHIIQSLLKEIGNKLISYNHTIETHPGQFTVLASEKSNVVKNSLKDLEQHAEIFDLMGLPQDRNSHINIHLGTSRNGDKKLALDTWISNYSYLSDSVKKRITLENDDKEALFTIQDLMYVNEKVNIPLVFDSLHYYCHTGNYTYNETYDLAYSTWDKNITPCVHHSSSKKLWEDPKENNKRSHSDYIYELFDNLDKPVRIMLESKKKELSLLKYKQDYLK